MKNENGLSIIAVKSIFDKFDKKNLCDHDFAM